MSHSQFAAARPYRRPSKDAWLMEMAQVVAKRSTCLRLRVGCVLVDSKFRVLSTGYNGVARGLPHCDEHTCIGMQTCGAIHAEQNALIQCRDVDEVHSCYVTHSPCVACMKLLMATSCQRLVYEEYHPSSDFKWWLESGRELPVWEKSA